MPIESGGTRSRSGGMSVSLASSDGRVVGGGIAGLLVAAIPVQVVVGSFLSYNMSRSPISRKLIPRKRPHSVLPFQFLVRRLRRAMQDRDTVIQECQSQTSHPLLPCMGIIGFSAPHAGFKEHRH